MTTPDAVMPTMPTTPAPRDQPTWHARAGRLSARKRWALDELAAAYDPWISAGDDVLDPTPLRRARGVAVEIGAGTGEVAIALAAGRPDWIVLAAEVHRSSFATMLLTANNAGVANLRAAAVDGRRLLRLIGEQRRVDLVRVLFPDPWPKRRHRARRLVSPPFADLLARCLAPDGVVELATDDTGYARASAAVLGGDGRFASRPAGGADRPVTYYERRARQAGRAVHELRFALTVPTKTAAADRGSGDRQGNE